MMVSELPPQIDRRRWLQQFAQASTTTLMLGLGGCDSAPSNSGVGLDEIDQWVLGTVIGDSMAPHLLGTHWLATCSICEQRQPLSLRFQEGSQLVCRRCGQVGVPRLELQPADQLRLRRIGPHLPLEKLRRFQVIAIAYQRNPDSPSSAESLNNEWTIKRLWALPGEEPELRDGLWHIDSVPLRKDWNEQHMTRVLVHDDHLAYTRQDALVGLENKDFSAYENALPLELNHDALLELEASSAPGWFSNSENSGSPWARNSTGWKHSGAKRSTTLEYRHTRCVWGAATERGAIEAPVEDALLFDPVTPRRLHAVSGLMLDLEARIDARASLEIAIHDGTNWITWLWDRAEQELQVHDGEQLVSQHRWLPSNALGTIAVTTFDQQAGQLARDLSPSLDLLDRQGPVTLTPLSRPVRITARGEVELHGLRLWRDLLPTAPQSTGFDWRLGRKLGANEYFVMGDNFSVSLDSRTSRRGVSREEIVGYLPIERASTH